MVLYLVHIENVQAHTNVCIAACIVGIVSFPNSNQLHTHVFAWCLYLTAAYPFAVKENAAETCASKCKIGGSDDPLLQLEEGSTVTNKQEYDACYSRCVAQETKEVAEEREKVLTDLPGVC